MTGTALILNVDDSDAIRYAKTRALRHAGFEVVEAATGAEALRLTRELYPPLVLLDVKLPDISGIEVCRILKEEHPAIFVLQISASFVLSGDRVRGLESGADAYLTQPVEPEELVASVRALLRIRQAEDALRNLNEMLEQRVRERTAEIEEVNARLRQEIEERARAEAALVQSQKMEALGHLTGGIAHDFNNLLHAISGNLDLIRRRSTEPRVVALAERGLQAAERGAKITAQLLAFSRTQRLAIGPVAVNDVIKNSVRLLKQSIGPQVRICSDLADDAGAAMSDTSQLELALLNLAINARDAMPDGGELTISTRRIETADDPELPPGAYVVVEVADTGGGIPPEMIDRVFDPFFTTKEPGRGTGLGLAQVYAHAQQAGGTVRIASVPGQGTRVRLMLPATEQPAEAEAAGEAVRLPRGTEIVLVIDDDLDVRRTIVESLADLGYRVEDAGDGTAGLTAIEKSLPNLVILDFAMPGMGGADLAAIIRTRWPAVPILFASGHADTDFIERVSGAALLLRKPFLAADLAIAVRRVLDERRVSTG